MKVILRCWDAILVIFGIKVAHSKSYLEQWVNTKARLRANEIYEQKVAREEHQQLEDKIRGATEKTDERGSSQAKTSASIVIRHIVDGMKEKGTPYNCSMENLYTSKVGRGLRGADLDCYDIARMEPRHRKIFEECVSKFFHDMDMTATFYYHEGSVFKRKWLGIFVKEKE